MRPPQRTVGRQPRHVLYTLTEFGDQACRIRGVPPEVLAVLVRDATGLTNRA